MSSWKDILKNVAPVLGTAVGGPMAGTAVKYLTNKILGDPDATENDLKEFIQTAAPEDLKAIKELDLDFKKHMASVGVDVFKLEVQDRGSARELAKKDMRPQMLLSLVFLVGYFALMFALFSGNVVIPEKLDQVASVLIGIMTTSVPMILQFWFGSSSGSKEKDYLMGGAK